MNTIIESPRDRIQNTLDYMRLGHDAVYYCHGCKQRIVRKYNGLVYFDQCDTLNKKAQLTFIEVTGK